MKKLFDALETLNDYEKYRILELINALKTPIEEYINPEAEYFNENSISDFKSRLLSQHVFLDAPLFQDTFESTFIFAMKAGGFHCEKAPDGERFWDVAIEGRKISLKSTKEKNLQQDKLKISKLTEAAWIQDCRSAAQREQHTKDLFHDYVSIVDSIIQLRYFIKMRKYELVEIPAILFNHVQELPREAFNADGPTLGIPIGENPPYLKIKLDRSDAKITINAILKSHCKVLARWTIG